jgi:oligopeptide/dipeptide ABC transporter ATP-binding protein
VERGQAVGVVGESGSGKSLTALAVAQLVEAPGRVEAHRLVFDGSDLLDKRDRRSPGRLLGQSLAVVFQDPMTSFNPGHRMGSQLAEGARQHQGLSRRAALTRAVDRLRAVRLSEPERRARQYPFEFSGGMRQRAMIAMGLMGSPQLIIADEPTTALDVTVQQQVLDLISEVRTMDGAALLMISHDVSVVAQVCDRVLVMYAGRIVEELSASDLWTGARHPYTRALVAAVPDMATDIDAPLASIPGRPVDPAEVPAGCAYAARCPLADDRCRSSDPELVSDMDGNAVACWHADETRSFDPTVLDGVSLTVPDGQVVGLVGESGSGKSTLARAAVGLAPLAGGRILLDGARLPRRGRRRPLQMVFQDPYSSLDPRMTIGESITESIPDRLTRTARAAEIIRLLELVHLDPACAGSLPGRLSGGQRQRVALARALAGRPEVVIADEITSALDVSVQGAVLNLVRETQRKLGLSMLFISHNLAVVRYVADRVAVMHQGRIVEQGPVTEVLEHPAHAYTQRLLAAVPGRQVPLRAPRGTDVDVPGRH